MSSNTVWRLLLSVLAIGAAVFLVVNRDPQLGLDLRGGTQVVLDLKPRDGQQLSTDTANRTLEVLRRRVDSLGVSEPSLAVAGDSRIIVELPGVTDPTQAVQVIGSTAQLTFHPVLCQQSQQTPACVDPATLAALTASAKNAAPTTPTGSPTSRSTSPPTTATSESAPTTAPASPATTSAGLGADTKSGAVLGQALETPVTTVTSNTAATPAPAPIPAAAATNANTNQAGAIVVPDDAGAILSLGPSALDGSGVESAEAIPPGTRGGSPSWTLDVKFKGDASDKWAKLTGAAACNSAEDPKRQVAIVLDNRAISHPAVDGSGSSSIQCGVGITGGQTVISGNFTQAQAKNLALLIRGGALPVDVKVASQQVVGPELGKSAINASRNAVMIGGALTILYLLIYYRVLGLIASIALAAYALISYAVLIGLNLTLTLPGIAGFVLAVGMAMDSNVLVYERVKEELATGRTMRTAAHLGFKNALSAIIDSNATTFLAAGTLFFFAIGAVKGFGVTLLVGTAVSIFTTLVILRSLVHGVLGMEWARKRPGLMGMYVGAKFRNRMSERPPNVIGASKYFLVGSTLLVVLALAGIGVRGINYGIEFTGGRLIEFSTKNPVPVDQARTEMGRIGFARAVVQRSGKADTSVRIAALNKEDEAKVTEVISRLGGGDVNKLRDETIGPSFGSELKRNAIKGLAIGIALQLAWVAFRFRWTFGIGAVVGMLHDGLLILGLFAWLHKPFDAVFLASLLTIIAFSVNDSVVVFDRIREQRRRRSGESFARVVSDACAQTFPRTVNLSLSAIFILGSLFFLGGQTLSDFSLAILLGVITGIYSSVMVASPIAVVLERWKPGITSRTTTSAGRRKASTAAVKPAGEQGAVSETSVGSRPAPRPRKKAKKRR